MTLIEEQERSNVIKSEVEEVIEGIIYKATNIKNGKVYIGQTRQSLTIRKNRHVNHAFNENVKNYHFHNAIKKHGVESFQWETIDTASNQKELNKKETHWISYFESNGTNGYNLTSGGDGVKGYKANQEGIQRRKELFQKMWANGHAETVPRGENAHNSLLKDKETKRIVELLIEGSTSVEEIAKTYNVNNTVIYGIQSGKTRKHLISEEDLKAMQKSKLSKAKGTMKLTDEDVLSLKNLLLYSDMNSLEIYEIFDINKAAAASVLKRKKWSHLFTEDEIFKIKNRKLKNEKSKFEPSKSEILKIKILQLQKELGLIKMTQVEMAKVLKVSIKTIKNIKTRNAHKNIQLPENYKDLIEYKELIESKILEK